MSLGVSVGIACGVGGKTDAESRPKYPNEDAVAALGCVIATENPVRTLLEATTDTPSLVFVADGLGGHAGGDRASREVALRLAARADSFGSPTSVNGELGVCHDMLKSIAEREPSTKGMGTTIAGLAVHRNKAVVFNVGDSRVYRMQDNRMVQLSVDDAPTPVSAGSNVLTKAIGTGSLTGSEVVANQRLLIDLRDGDRFLLCTDGLSDYVARGDIERTLSTFDDPVEIAHELYGLALAANTRDNVSVVVMMLSDIVLPSVAQPVLIEKPAHRRRLSLSLKRRRVIMHESTEEPGSPSSDL